MLSAAVHQVVAQASINLAAPSESVTRVGGTVSRNDEDGLTLSYTPPTHVLENLTGGGLLSAAKSGAKLDVAQISDITRVDAPDTFERPIYAGNAMAVVQSADATKVITVRTTGFDAAAATGGSAAVESVAAATDSGKSSFLGSEIAKNDRPDLTAAKIVVSGYLVQTPDILNFSFSNFSISFEFKVE